MSAVKLLNQIALPLSSTEETDELFAKCKNFFEELKNFDWVDSKSITFAIEIVIEQYIAEFKAEHNALIRSKVAEFQNAVDKCGRDVAKIDKVFLQHEKLMELKAAFNNIDINNRIMLMPEDAKKFGINVSKIRVLCDYEEFWRMFERLFANVVKNKFQGFDNVTEAEALIISRYCK